jgi:hypothetical protein
VPTPPPPPPSKIHSNLLGLFKFAGLFMIQLLIQMKLVCLNLTNLSN